MTIEEQLLEATAAISGVTAERDDLRATVEKLTVGAASELEALKVSVAEKDAKLAELTAALEVAAKEVEGFKAMVAELEASKVNASKEAAKIVASVGVSPVELSPADSKPSAEAVDHLATFLSLPVGSARSATNTSPLTSNAIVKACYLISP
jgi:peptidoglycan hydrolase CwlO-like protein